MDLKSQLDRYAALHSQAHGEAVDAVAMIPHMLAAFVERDRVFKALSRSPVACTNAKARMSVDPPSDTHRRESDRGL
ncbi:DUF2274 domain-containing protein [Diaphorobacter nitroreducens]|uniref:DUF2274 domain-containing protein n=1 Tax=Diaphorobacter nitroreducens TaxID=164759 RepID=UPI003AAE3524